jgi:molecular chaperone GrpE
MTDAASFGVAFFFAPFRIQYLCCQNDPKQLNGSVFVCPRLEMKFNFSLSGKKRVMNKEQEENIAEENQSGAPDTPITEATTTDSELSPCEKTELELAELKDQHRRLYAEFDNFRKRSLKERMDLIKTAGSDTIVSLLPVIDDFDRALKSLEAVEDGPLKEGVLLIHNKLLSILSQKGLKSMETVNSDFDTDLHEAVTNIPAGEDKTGKVIDELEKGYMLHDKVIRYAKVVVGS